jgi:hypothetical protein
MRYFYIVMAAALFMGAAGEVANAKSRAKPGDVTGSVRAEWTQTRQTDRAATVALQAERPKYRCATLTCPNFIMIGVGF